MSSGSDVVAGPEVEMVEPDVASSGPLAVDLNLNLGPSFALELALGGQDSEETVPVSRPNWNWPRFEPSILGGGQEDEVPPVAEDAVPEDPRGGAAIRALLHRLGTSSPGAGRDQIIQELDTAVERSLAGLLQPLRGMFPRNARPTRYPRQPRQASFSPVLDLVQAQDSSEHGSTSQARAVAASDTAVSRLFPRTSVNDGPPSDTAVSRLFPRMSVNDVPPSNTAFDITPSPDSSNQNGKLEVGAAVGAGFECNVCLEMATEPVVTCCGHLFCWSCLYKWLHLHSSQKECPVCKGFLSDDSITPIYGRGTVQDAEKVSGSIPPRPHAYRANAKRKWPNRVSGERLARGVAAARPEVIVDRRQGETSNAANRVLNRLRVAQRLQREYTDDRRFHQLISTRVTGFLRPGALITVGASVQDSSASPTPSLNQHHAEDVPISAAINETVDSVAAIGASMDELREGLEHMQRTLDTLSTQPTQTGIHNQHRAADAGSSSVWPLVNETRIAQSLRDSANNLSHAETPVCPLTTSRQRGVSDVAGSSDVEPGSFQSRKRRRLN